MGTLTNPYLPNDVTTIIDAFIRPDPAGVTAGAQTRDGISNLMERVRQYGGDYSYAAMTERLQSRIDQAQAAVDTLYSYGTFGSNSGDTVAELEMGPIKGVTAQNTWYTMFVADDPAKAAAAMAADCISCKDRVTTMLSLNPLEDAWGILNQMYQSSVKFVMDLFDLLLGDKSVQTFADFCSLFQFLNFMCVPDLYRIIMMFAQLLQQYAIKWSDITVTFSDVLGNILGPILTPVVGVLDQYIQLILLPIECILSSLDAQIQKLDVYQAFQKVTVDPETGRSVEIPIDEIMATLETPLASLRMKMQEAVDAVNEKFDKINASIREALGLHDAMDSEMFDLAGAIKTVTTYIGLAHAIIQAITQQQINCGPDGGTSAEDLQNFLNNYVAPQFDLDIVIAEGQAVLRPKTPADIEELLAVVGSLQKDVQNTDSPDVVPEPKVAQAVVPLKNCLYTVTDRELDNVKDYLSTFQHEGGK